MKTIAFGVLIVLFLVTESVADIQLMKVPQSKGELNFLCLWNSDEQDGDVDFILRNETVCRVWTKTGEPTLRNKSVGENHFCKSLFHNTSLKGMLSQYTIVQPTSNSEGDWTCEFRNNAMIERSEVVQVKNISKENGGNLHDGHVGSANCTLDTQFGLFFGGMILAFVICVILICILKWTSNGLTVGKSTCLSKLLCLAVRNDERLNNGAGRQPRVRYVEGSNDGAGVNLNPEDAAEPDDE